MTVIIIIIIITFTGLNPHTNTPPPTGLSLRETRTWDSVCSYTSHQEQILMPNFLAVGHALMHLSSANSNVTPTLGRDVRWNVMNNLIKLHSGGRLGITKGPLPHWAEPGEQEPPITVQGSQHNWLRRFRNVPCHSGKFRNAPLFSFQVSFQCCQGLRCVTPWRNNFILLINS